LVLHCLLVLDDESQFIRDIPVKTDEDQMFISFKKRQGGTSCLIGVYYEFLQPKGKVAYTRCSCMIARLVERKKKIKTKYTGY
jgi:hypothetical protein